MKAEFEKYPDGLMPAIIQDLNTGKVLMLGFMNEEAFEQTKKTSLVTFFSRSKNRLWVKGESSHNFLHVEEIRIDCDNDTFLVKVTPAGPVCHTGADTCFNEINNSSDFLSDLETIISDRIKSGSKKSYVSTLFQNGINKIAQKVGEEAIELIIEAKDTNEDLFQNEAADLLFHYLILLQAKGYKLEDIIKILKLRHAAK